jgi:hypothetical protein
MKQSYKVSKKSIASCRKNGRMGGRPKGVKNKIKFLFIGILNEKMVQNKVDSYPQI